jgi:hypothetical protein
MARHQADPEFARWVWAVVDVPVERTLGPAETINITVLDGFDQLGRSQPRLLDRWHSA